MNSIKQEIFAYVRRTYQVEPDYPFPIAPTYPVLRHPDNKKLFALLMDVPRERLGLAGEERVDILNLKCSAAPAEKSCPRPEATPTRPEAAQPPT